MQMTILGSIISLQCSYGSIPKYEVWERDELNCATTQQIIKQYTASDLFQNMKCESETNYIVQQHSNN